MKNTDFRNFLDTVDSLVEGKAPRKTLKESPGDTYYVSKMKERFIAMEADENNDGEPEQEFNSSSEAEDTLSDAPKTDSTLDKEELSSAIETIKTALESSPEAKTSFEEVLKHFGCDTEDCGTEEPAEDVTETKDSEHKGATTKWNFGSFMK